ncbi:hypothetical protein QVD17_34917 [Tagetes erecta]|uniref:Uncharacterized protein n=1 Tax=Tagetes erecta TaxID=13708 RepID=A0AAD8NKP9_TARER|nr:hypothetical protein QVD17_34917 [Tagetes erecta]
MLVKCIFHLGVNKSSKCNEIVTYLSRSCKYMEHSLCYETVIIFFLVISHPPGRKLSTPFFLQLDGSYGLEEMRMNSITILLQ